MSGNLDKLPTEILGMILEKLVDINRSKKNGALPARQVCKRFDAILRATLFKTIQLDFERLSRTGSPIEVEFLSNIGPDVKCVVIDLSVIRSQAEVKDLRVAFSSITERITDSNDILKNLSVNTMGEETFDEADFKELVNEVFVNSPNVHKLKICLPYKIVGQPPIHATTLFANLLECMANREGDHEPITTLVIAHLSDTTLIKLYANPMDLKNAFKVFEPLRHLVINFKRQEYDNHSQASFQAGFHRLLCEASQLRSLCLSSWNVNRITRERASQGGHRVDRDKWSAQCLPYRSLNDGKLRLGNLRYIELKRVDIHARSLMAMLFDCSKNLRELYLNQVYLKHDQRTNAGNPPYLWIGHGADHQRSANELWVAEEIKKLRDAGALKLDVLRASALGYDYINPAPGVVHSFDLEDPSGNNRSFDERFVQRAMDFPVPEIGTAVIPPVKYDVDATQLYHNTTSGYLKSLDGLFQSYNTQSLGEIVKLIAVVDESMKTLNTQLMAVNHAGRGGPAGDDQDDAMDVDDNA